ncbi:hypothetical protein MTHERMOG20_10080 [Moorella thermoacetica]|uniref:Uncharacterized protein n=1 Tax=Neomoorella thermoacetica TaxID=1525 RepID=A0AAC9HHK7_NEOTH|nr:hypothetical protein [Moorella thermoacetica]AKX94612.1 hypothetical protein MOTHE_c18230 [Moorella thermoacetica]AKX97248.1 hypothetical protein MOTHA_c19060 [Moorella thermoacetica]AOQ23825.1 hypothetical protein Maut_01377 [Moorella thermoacetica]OIQ57333.1 hypothetical protein MOCA_09190 [Moorella thermoacetica]QDA01078.1 hypothetical protein MothHH_01945 [Moorella thermoacetica]
MTVLDYARWRAVKEVPGIIDTLAAKAKQGDAAAARLMLELAGVLPGGEGGDGDGEEKQPRNGSQKQSEAAVK